MSKEIVLGPSLLPGGALVKLTFDASKVDKKVSGQYLPDASVPLKLPKKLEEVNTENAFVSYCKLAYLRVNGENVYVYHDKPSGSITPRSESITVYDNTVLQTEAFRVESIKNLEVEKNVIQTSVLSPSSILNQYILKADKVLDALNNGIVFCKEYQQHIRGKDLQPSISTDTKPLVCRFGMNPEALTLLVGEKLSDDKFHFVELEIFQKAFLKLNSTESAENMINNPSAAYPNNVVLVDIFVREEGKIKKDDGSDNPETHTIALWKKTDNVIILIDPSKVEYSSKLKKAVEDAFRMLAPSVEVKVHSPTKNILYGTGGKDTGYTELTSTPIDKHLYRDCVDVAVKIGFELNELQLNENPLTLVQIESALNLQISNQKDVATYLSNPSHGLPNRALLSSDVNIRHLSRSQLETKK